jgi:hypothetical protein
MPDHQEPMNAETQLLFGVQLAVIHIFNCLNGKGILPFSESIQSLKETIKQSEGRAPIGAKVALESIIASLEIIAAESDEPDPSRPASPTRLH